MPSSHLRSLSIVLVLLGGCSDDRGIDAGPVLDAGDQGTLEDAGGADASRDAGPADAGGEPDAGRDAGPIDGALPEGGPIDAAVADAGPSPCAVPARIALGAEINTWVPTSRADTVWTGDGWLHVQGDYGTDEDVVSAARITRDGVREAAMRVQGVPHSALAGWIGTSVVWTGSGALAAWVRFHTSASNQVWLAPLAADGAPEDTPRAVITAPNGYWIDAAWTGSQLGLAHGGSGVRFLRVGADGAPMGDVVTLLASGTTSPVSVAFNGSQYGVTWTDAEGAHLARVGTDGVADVAQLVVPTADHAAVEAPMLFADGSEWLLALRAEAVVRVYRLSPIGVVRDFADIVLTDPHVGTEQGHRDYAVLPEPDGLAFAYVQERESLEIVFGRTDRAGAPRGPELALTSHAGASFLVAQGPDLMATDGAPALTWSDRVTSSSGIRRHLRSACE